MYNFAVIPTRNRPDVLLECLEWIEDQVDGIVVINNGDEELSDISSHDWDGQALFRVIDEPEQPVNLSRLWNVGLDAVEQWVRDAGLEQWNVAILNDDAIVPPDWFKAVGTAMRDREAAAACSDPNGTHLVEPMLLTVPGPVGLTLRMVGWAFLLAGEKGVRADENLKIWFGDDDIDWQSRQLGGMLMIPGHQVINRFPNGQFTPELHRQSELDREAFVQKWGNAPW